MIQVRTLPSQGRFSLVCPSARRRSQIARLGHSLLQVVMSLRLLSPRPRTLLKVSILHGPWGAPATTTPEISSTYTHEGMCIFTIYTEPSYMRIFIYMYMYVWSYGACDNNRFHPHRPWAICIAWLAAPARKWAGSLSRT